jgi:hypothetical protein
MIKSSLIAIFAMLCLNIFSQDIDKSFFLLGMLSNSNLKPNANAVDIDKFAVGPAAQKFYKVLRELRDEKFKNQVITIDTVDSRTVIFKNEVMNKYFRSFYKQSECYNYMGEKLYGNYMEFSQFDSNKKIYSYIAGNYSIRGTKDSASYYITFNSIYKSIELLNFLLSKYSAGSVIYTRYCNTIPTTEITKFTLYCDDMKNEKADWIDKKLIQETLLLKQYLESGKKP